MLMCLPWSKELEDKEHSSKRPATECEACGQRYHSIKRCWIAISEIRPDDFTVPTARVNQLRMMLADNPALKAKVDEARQAAQAKKNQLRNRQIS